MVAYCLFSSFGAYATRFAQVGFHLFSGCRSLCFGSLPACSSTIFPFFPAFGIARFGREFVGNAHSNIAFTICATWLASMLFGSSRPITLSTAFAMRLYIASFAFLSSQAFSYARSIAFGTPWLVTDLALASGSAGSCTFSVLLELVRRSSCVALIFFCVTFDGTGVELAVMVQAGALFLSSLASFFRP